MRAAVAEVVSAEERMRLVPDAITDVDDDAMPKEVAS
jgi:hypothetical protein